MAKPSSHRVKAADLGEALVPDGKPRRKNHYLYQSKVEMAKKILGARSTWMCSGSPAKDHPSLTGSKWRSSFSTQQSEAKKKRPPHLMATARGFPHGPPGPTPQREGDRPR